MAPIKSAMTGCPMKDNIFTKRLFSENPNTFIKDPSAINIKGVAMGSNEILRMEAVLIPPLLNQFL